MSETVRRESPLVQCNVAAGSRRNASVTLGERAFLRHLNLRGDPSDPSFLKAVEGVLGCGLPLEPNTVMSDGGLAALWLGPDEWLLIAPPEQETKLLPKLQEALEDSFAAVTDVSGGQTIITLEGEHAREVMAKGCSLDLHPRVFGPGRCAQTLIAKTGALLRQTRDDPPVFEIVVRRSFADYLWRWLEDAAGEYGT